MARPRREVGTHSAITVTPQVLKEGRWVTADEDTKPERYRARAQVRDHDGRTREVARFAPTKGRARTAVETALRDRVTPHASHHLRPGMRFGDAGELWLAQVKRPDSGLAESTRDQYVDGWNRWIAGTAFADFTLAEANSVPRIRAFVQDCADAHGTGAADSIKSLISSVITLAVTDGALESNACRLVKPAKRATEAVGELSARDKALLAAGWTLAEIQPDHERAFTADERAAVVAKARADDALNGTARRADAADLTAFMAAVGTRIEEALSVRWEGVNLDNGTVHVPGTKTETSDRTLEVAPWLVDTLRARWRLEGSPTKGYVFHAPLGGLEAKRDRRNASRALRRVLDGAGHPWAVPHTFRRTVATLLDQRGVPLAQIADYLGHADPAMTARVYLGRKMSTSLAASRL